MHRFADMQPDASGVRERTRLLVVIDGSKSVRVMSSPIVRSLRRLP